MIALLQRVTQAAVRVNGETVGEIGPGLLAFIGVQRGDGDAQVARLLERVLGYRIFEDDSGRMNRSLTDTGGGLLLVPQFTLAADTRKGTRPSFTPAADPARGRQLFEALAAAAGRQTPTATGRFGADMKVSLVNDGPVTFWLEVPPRP
ncbi:MAG: D-aminoacyl-tRNA deacylase [Ectothiorhodospiraceae bacterium]|jgi:D-tyrosyl-tRNA(Tyr) deacylase